jgi:predicted lactoylglutathione lyase
VPFDHVNVPVSDLDASRAFYYYAAFVLDPDRSSFLVIQ